MYDSEDDLDERVCNKINYFLLYAFSKVCDHIYMSIMNIQVYESMDAHK